ncbi:MAG: ABC transporter ATP-binding protein [Bacteroidales bacterium]|nr:ABC transporter ATP-binding protein [Bacteroidales bacterium]
MFKKVVRILHFALPYKANVTFVFIFHLLSSVFSVFSLSMIIPFLSILFGQFPKVTEPVPFALNYDSIVTNFSYYISNLIDSKGDLAALGAISVGVLMLFFLKNLAHYLASYNMSPVTTGVVCDLRNALYQKTLHLPLGYYSEERKGDLIARVSNDVLEVEVSVLRSLELIFRDPLLIIIYLSTLIVLSPQLTGLVLLMILLTALIIGRIGRTLRKTSVKVQNQLGFLLSLFEETLGGLKIIKSFNAENKSEQRFRDSNNVFRRLVIKMWRRRDLASPMSEFLGAVVVVIIIYIGGRIVLAENGALKPATLIGYLVIFSQIIQPAKSLSQSYYNILKGYASIERINKILHADNPITNVPKPVEAQSFNQSIEYKNVNFKYAEAPVLKNINLCIEKGKTIALVGQSGSGKTTLADVLPRFWDVQDGEILIDSIPIKNIKLSDLRGLMGIVSQEAILFNDSFFNNIAFGSENATLEQVIAAAKVANAHDFIMATEKGYESNVGDRGSKLSGGQRQRISIARAVFKNPPILILDEATSALDTESEYLVQEALTNLMKNRTSIVIAHRLSTIRNADTICVMHEGRIVEQGTHDQLLSLSGVYKKLYEMQVF